MFESVEERSKHRPWRTFGIVSSIFFAGLWLVMHARAEQEESRIEEAREARAEIRANNDKPRILKAAGPVRVPVAVDQAPGWSQAPGQDLGVLDGPHDLRLQTNLLDRGEGSVADQVVAFFRGTHFTLYEPASTRNEKVFYSATLVTHGAAYNAAILAWRCPDDRVALVVVTSATSSLGPGILLADSGRCVQDPE